MTRLDLQTRLQNHFNNTVYYSPQDLNDSLQDGYDEIAAFSGCIYKSAVLPFTQNTTYYDFLTLLGDYVGVVGIFNDVTRRWMWPESLRKLELADPEWDVRYGTPSYFVSISHRYVAIWRKPNVANYGRMFIFYRAAATTLTDSDQIQIPDDHLLVLEEYSKTDLWEQNQEWGKASLEFKSYADRLERFRVLMRNARNSDRQMSLK